MKKLLIALIAVSFSLGITSSVLATPLLGMPQATGGIILGVTGYYLQALPNRDDLLFITSDCNSGTFHQRYDWGWGVNVGYIFPCTCTDVNLNYFNLETCKDHSVSGNDFSLVPAGNIFNFPLTDPSFLDPTLINNARLRVDHDFDQLDLSIGHYMNIGCRFRFHPFVGLRGLELKRNSRTDFLQSTEITTDSNIVQSQNITFNEKSRFQGLGPLVGFDTDYCLACGFSIRGHADTGLLVGRTRFSTQEKVEQVIAVPESVSDFASSVNNFNPKRNNRVVPVTALRLGGAYTWVFKNCCCCPTTMTIEAGWMVSYYFNVVDRFHTDTRLQNSAFGAKTIAPIASAGITGEFNSDIALNGPYVSLVFHL